MTTSINAIGQAGLAADYILGTMRLTCSEEVRGTLRAHVSAAVAGRTSEKMSVSADWWKPSHRAAEAADKMSLTGSIEIEVIKIDLVVNLLNAARVSDESVMSSLVDAVSKLASNAV